MGYSMDVLHRNIPPNKYIKPQVYSDAIVAMCPSNKNTRPLKYRIKGSS